eukprot:CAMPEP_0175307726 /NCGR_PEP_ID=MMETSP0093-20121207/64919_1 /TAXON_ID=311494 /ORGANISM="Alexandrium monilatum, Strain CCMP3105" /LENGTH=95 /DNA_ID=CAMNT_0016604215 /DNA_START=114 /DNA_END=402 /DNA_ORIENTATION=-
MSPVMPAPPPVWMRWQLTNFTAGASAGALAGVGCGRVERNAQSGARALRQSSLAKHSCGPPGGSIMGKRVAAPRVAMPQSEAALRPAQIQRTEGS